MVRFPIRWVTELGRYKQLYACLFGGICEFRLCGKAWRAECRNDHLCAQQRLLERCGVVIVDLNKRSAKFSEFGVLASALDEIT